MKKKKIITLSLSLLLALSAFGASVMAEGNDLPEPPQFQENEGMQDGQPPEKPDGEVPPMPMDNMQNNMGQMPQGQPPEKPEGENFEAPKMEFEQGQDKQRPELPADENAPEFVEQGQVPQGEMPQFNNQDTPAQDGQQPGQNQNGPMNFDQQNNQGQMPGQPAQDNQMNQNNNDNRSFIQKILDKIYELFNIKIDYEDLGLQEDKPADMNNNQMPSDMNNNQQPGDMNNQMPGQNNQGPQNGGFPGQSNTVTTYDSANNVTEDASDSTYSSSSDSQNAVLVDGDTVTLSNITVDKTGNSSSESADFNGTNAAVLANNGATLTISDSTVTSNGSHANGVFAYGTGTTLNISDSTITTSGNNSGGLMTTGGATLNATNLTVTTSGNSSAAIRTDRGGGDVNVDEGSYTTSGVGSPAIYSTADVSVSDATLSASTSEAVVIEGGNSVTITNSTVTGNNSKLNGQSTVATNVLIYQSMSGEASEGASTFTMTGGSLTAETGSMFHVTNVTTTINLSNVTLNYASDDLLILSADSWGTSGKNGGNATVNLDDQEVEGKITVDSVSSLKLNITNGSDYTGSIANSGTATVYLENGSTWTLTGDSYVTSISGDLSGLNLNGYKLYVNGVEYNA